MSAWKEFLIDPAAFADSWADCRFLCDGLGWEQGRLMWQPSPDVLRRYEVAIKNCKDPKRHLIEARFAEFMSLELPKRRRNGVVDPLNPVGLPQFPWNSVRDAALQREDCAGVIGRNADESEAVYPVEKLASIKDPWRTDVSTLRSRKREHLLQLVRPLIFRSRELILIDPYLDPSEDNERAKDLEGYLDLQDPQKKVRCELHIHGSDSVKMFRTLAENLKKVISPMLRSNQSLECFVWDKSTSRAEFHDRYILTELGGISLGTGLGSHFSDEHQTNCSLPSAGSREALKRQFASTSESMKLVGQVKVG